MTPNGMHGLTVLVTGSSGTIGTAVSIRLARRGAGLVLMGRDQVSLQATAECVEKAGGSADVWVLDFGSQELPRRLRELRDQQPDVDIIVHCAGDYPDTRERGEHLALMMEQAQVHAFSFVLLADLYRHHMSTNGFGRLVGISSAAAALGSQYPSYAMAKGALGSAVRSLARTLISDGVTVNAVLPGPIETRMTERIPESKRQALLSRVPAGRFGTAQEVAALVEFLCGRDAGYITGQSIHINGGLHCGQ